MLKRRRTFSRRRRRTRGRPRMRSKSKRSRTLTKKIQRVINKNVEKKAVGSVFNGTASHAILSAFALNDIEGFPSAGNAWNLRVGQEYFLTSIQIRMALIPEVAPGYPAIYPFLLRVAVVAYEGINNATVGIPNNSTEFLTNVNLTKQSVLVNTNQYQSMTYPIDPAMFKVYHDKVYKVGAVGNGQDIKRIGFNVPVMKSVKTVGNLQGSGFQNRRFFLMYWSYCPQLLVGEDIPVFGISFSWKTFYRDG